MQTYVSKSNNYILMFMNVDDNFFYQDRLPSRGKIGCLFEEKKRLLIKCESGSKNVKPLFSIKHTHKNINSFTCFNVILLTMFVS